MKHSLFVQFTDEIYDRVHMFITIGVYTPLYSFSLFLPTIVANLGYTENTAQLYASLTKSIPKPKVDIRGLIPHGVA